MRSCTKDQSSLVHHHNVQGCMSPYVLTEHTEKDPPWAEMFADDMVHVCYDSCGSGGRPDNMESCV